MSGMAEERGDWSALQSLHKHCLFAVCAQAASALHHYGSLLTSRHPHRHPHGIFPRMQMQMRGMRWKQKTPWAGDSSQKRQCKVETYMRGYWRLAQYYETSTNWNFCWKKTSSGLAVCSLKQRNHRFILPLHMLHSDQVWVLLSQMEEVVISWYLSHHTHTSTSVMHSRKRWWLGKGLNTVIFNLSSEHLVSRNEGQRAEQSHEKGIKDNLPAGWLLLNWQPQKFPFLQAQSRKTVFLVTQ